VVTVPNLNSLSKRLKGRRWSAYRDRTHRSLAAPEQWGEWFRAEGFEVLRVGTDALWDPPYLCRWPGRLARLERLAILMASNLAMLLKPQWSWSRETTWWRRSGNRRGRQSENRSGLHVCHADGDGMERYAASLCAALRRAILITNSSTWIRGCRSS